MGAPTPSGFMSNRCQMCPQIKYNLQNMFFNFVKFFKLELLQTAWLWEGMFDIFEFVLERATHEDFRTYSWAFLHSGIMPGKAQGSYEVLWIVCLVGHRQGKIPLSLSSPHKLYILNWYFATFWENNIIWTLFVLWSASVMESTTSPWLLVSFYWRKLSIIKSYR